MDPFRVELSMMAKVLFVLSIIATFGTATIVLWWLVWYRYPRVLDREGVTTRGGARYRWADVEEVLTIRRRSSRGLRISFAGGGRILVVPNMIASPEAVLAYIDGSGIRSSSWR